MLCFQTLNYRYAHIRQRKTIQKLFILVFHRNHHQFLPQIQSLRWRFETSTAKHTRRRSHTADKFICVDGLHPYISYFVKLPVMLGKDVPLHIAENRQAPDQAGIVVGGQVNGIVTAIDDFLFAYRPADDRSKGTIVVDLKMKSIFFSSR